MLILHTLLSLFTISIAWGGSLRCQKLFDGNIQTTPFLSSDFTIPTNNNKKLPATSTVITAETFKDTDGSNLLVLKRTGKSWNSTYTPVVDNHQGDPRWFGMLFGPQVSYYFGFRKVGDNVMTAPTAATFNSRINELNKKLKDKGEEPIHIGVHEAKPSAEEGIEYLKNIYENNSLPLASSGHYAVHDLSYHLMAILMPKYIVEGVKSRIGVLLRLKEKLDNDTSLSRLDRYVLDKAVESLVNQMVRYIDFGTGNIGYVTLMEKTGRLNSRSKPYGVSDFKSLVIDYLVRDAQQVIEKIEEGVESTFTSSVLKKYASTDFKDYFFEGMSPKDKELIVQQTARVVADFMKDFLRLEQENIEASRQDISAEDMMAFIKERIDLFNGLVP